MAKMQSAWSSQSQRTRYVKTGAIIFFVFFLFYYFSPSGLTFTMEVRAHLCPISRRPSRRIVRSLSSPR